MREIGGDKDIERKKQRERGIWRERQTNTDRLYVLKREHGKTDKYNQTLERKINSEKKE